MTLNNHDFIKRYKTHTRTEHSKRGHESVIYVIAAFTFILLSMGFIYLFYTSAVNDMIKGLALITLCAAYLFGYGIFLILQKRELKLVREIIEGGGGARIVTDSNGKTVLSNKAFHTLCIDHTNEKIPSLECMMLLFDGIPENKMKFDSLQEQAKQGLINVIEICSKLPDNERWFTISIRPLKSHKAVSYTHLTLPTICSV